MVQGEDNAMAVDVKAGDRVRVVLEGVAVWGEDESFMVGSHEPNIIFPGAGHVVSVEVLAPPEPPVGSVVLDSDGDAWQRRLTVGYGWLGALLGNDSGDFRSWEDLNSTCGPLKVIHEAE